MNRGTLWWLAALLLVAATAAGWRQWRVWNTIRLPEPVRADWELTPRPGPVVFHTDGGGRPSTLKEMLGAMDAVVLARMDNPETEEAKTGQARSRRYYTGFRFMVMQAVTGHVREGEHIIVWRLGKREDREEYFERPELGQTFVLFLRRFHAANGYSPYYGKYGTYAVTNGLLHQLWPHPTTAAYEGKPVELFLVDLKALSKTM